MFGIPHSSGIKHLLHSNDFPFLDVCFRAQLWRQHFPLCWYGHRARRWVDILLFWDGVIGFLKIDVANPLIDPFAVQH